VAPVVQQLLGLPALYHTIEPMKLASPTQSCMALLRLALCTATAPARLTAHDGASALVFNEHLLTLWTRLMYSWPTAVRHHQQLTLEYCSSEEQTTSPEHQMGMTIDVKLTVACAHRAHDLQQGMAPLRDMA
jgi:hypothetical protein